MHHITYRFDSFGYGKILMPAHVDKKGMSVLLRLSPEMTDMLSKAAERSGRSNTKEALLRLEDHLTYFTDLATAGRRFIAEDSE